LTHYLVFLEVADGGLCMVHVPDLPGCTVRAPTREEALRQLPEAIRRYHDWRCRHGEATFAMEEPIQVEIAEASAGFGPFNPGDAAALFEPDRRAITTEEIEYHLRLMSHSRADLVALARDLPDAILDWQPEAESFSIRRLLRHIGNAEEWYVSRIVSTETLPPEWKDDENMPIMDFLEMERRTALARLRQLTEAERSNVFYPQQWTQHPEEPWTARKVFRRFLEHEREHTDQIRRMLELYHSKQMPQDQEAHLSTEHDDPIEAIRQLYDQQPTHEWERMERHRTEFAVTLRALRDHLPPPPARVLDCGGGPGRYSIELAKRGYDVTLFDLSTECLRLAESKATEANVKLSALEHGTATNLARFADNSFDVVLLMGPLYHLLEERERLQALAEAHRVLKPGGTLFAALITRYAPFRYAAANEPDYLIQHQEEGERILSTGVLPPRKGGGFIAYFAHPAEVGPLVTRSGFEIVTILGVEGLVGRIEDGVNALSGPAWEAWVDLNYRVAADPSIHGGAEHLLVIALKLR